MHFFRSSYSTNLIREGVYKSIRHKFHDRRQLNILMIHRARKRRIIDWANISLSITNRFPMVVLFLVINF